MDKILQQWHMVKRMEIYYTTMKYLLTLNQFFHTPLAYAIVFIEKLSTENKVGTSSGVYVECVAFNNDLTKIFSTGEENENCPVIRIDSFGSVKLYLPNTAQQYKVAI